MRIRISFLEKSLAKSFVNASPILKGLPAQAPLLTDKTPPGHDLLALRGCALPKHTGEEPCCRFSASQDGRSLYQRHIHPLRESRRAFPASCLVS